MQKLQTEADRTELKEAEYKEKAGELCRLYNLKKKPEVFRQDLHRHKLSEQKQPEELLHLF